MSTALFETEVGNINIEFFSDDAPNTVKNFTNLISDGFYDGLAFHRVIPGFMAQGGCPNTRDGASGMPGTGGPGYNIKCEINSIEFKGRTIVLMFEDKDDATRYCGLLEAQDFPLPTVEMIDIEEIKDFCNKLDYEC